MENNQPTPTTAHHFRSGDVVRAYTGTARVPHVCIILQDYPPSGGAIPCMAYLNLTGSESGANLLEISGYPFDSTWFKERKPRTWVRCEETDCIYETDIIEQLGNVHVKDQHLWDTICDGYYACDIPDAIRCGCKNEHELTKRLVAAARLAEPSCSCSQRTTIPIVKQVH